MMKTGLKGLTMMLAVVTLTAFTTTLKDGQYTVGEESTITWNGKKVLGEHFGTVELQSGELSIKDGNLRGGTFTIDMTSITSTDLSGEYLDKLNGHLKSDDFFGVEKFPTSTFTIKKVKPKNGNGAYHVTGDATIKGITKPIEFDAQLVQVEDGIVAVADIVIDRSEFDVRYGSGSFFDNLGDKTIYDDFVLKVKLVTE